MPLSNGARVGPYEILAPIGAGGMGEVYRARDTRLARDVAVKILPVSFASDPDRLRRFEQEARATSQLNHPNILAVYDVGTHEGTPYLVEELLEGQTLRRAMAGAALPVRKAIDYAAQTARGLAAAHDKGVVHRDLKPDNIFVTHDGRIKILDFGLAKLIHPEGQESSLSAVPTAAETGPGVVLGTVGYMSPEQVRGRPADHRSDLFSLGALLYEMLSGRRAFAGDSSVETMNAILKEEPPLLSQTGAAIAPELERIVQHCLEKNSTERFQSARDLAFQLESMSGTGGTHPGSLTAGSAVRAGVRLRDERARTRWIAVSIVGAILVASVAGFVAGRSGISEATQLRYRPLTFRTGSIFSARFAPDGSTVVYAASWDGGAKDLYVTRTDSPGSRSLQIPDAEVLSISPSGEMALLMNPFFTQGWMRTGRLARVPLAGGVPREIIDGVQDADWAPDGENMAIARTLPTEYRLEYPVGNVLYTTRGWISELRISPDGERLAFIDHPGLGDDKGRVAMVDRKGTKTDLSQLWSSAQGLAWSGSGETIYFTAGGETGNLRSLRSVDLAGNAAVIGRYPASSQLMDLSADGRFLVVRWDARRGISGLAPGETTEKNLSWLDWSFLNDLSADGSTILFTEQGEGGGADYSNFVRPTDGSAAVRLSSGQGLALSRDGKLALIGRFDARNVLVIVPTGAGEERTIELPFDIVGGTWHPDGRRFVINAVEPGSGVRAFLIEEGGAPRAITPPGAQFTAIAPDGRHLVAVAAIGLEAPMIYPIEGGGEPRAIAGVGKEDYVMGWSADGGSLLAARNTIPVRVDRVDLKTGERTLWREIMPADQAGILDIGPLFVSRDGLSYAYTYRRVLSTLYLAEP